MTPVFINFTRESFTPTESGALATVIYECCRAAAKLDEKPVVISIAIEAKPFGWPDAIYVRNPVPSKNRWVRKWWSFRQRLAGCRFPEQLPYFGSVVRTIRRAGLQHRPLVVMNDPEHVVFLRCAFPRANIVHWFQNQLDASPQLIREFRDSVTTVVACSNFTARWVESNYGLLRDSVRTVYNGVDLDQFSPAERCDRARPVVNFCGRTIREKAPDLLLKAIVLLAHRGIHYDVQIVGANHWDRFEMDDYQCQLRELAAQAAECGVQVNFTGRIGRTDIANWLCHADVHVTPSRWDEPFGITTVEGMACGLATIGSRTGGTPEVVGESGLLFDRDNVEDLADKLAEVYDETQRNAIGKRCRQRAEQFTWDNSWKWLKHAAARG